MADYMPSGDSEFEAWITNYINYVSANLADFHVTPGDMALLVAALAAYSASLGAIPPAEAALSAAFNAKTTARGVLADLARAQIRSVQADKTVSNEARLAAGLPVADATKTPVAVPTTAPTGRLEQSNPMELTVHFADSTTPTSKAKPAGVRGCQIWMTVGTTPPASPNDLHFLATDTRTPYVAHFDAADVGKTAYFRLRWENTRGEPGPWSAMISATITG